MKYNRLERIYHITINYTMRILVFDTETSGLPPKEFFNKVSLTSVNMWPYIVQFSYAIYDTETNSMDNVTDQIVKIPNHINLDGESETIHGITNLVCQTRGVSIENVLAKFTQDCERVDLIVGHNIDFDINMLKAEWYRLISNKSAGHIHTNGYAAFGRIMQQMKTCCTLKENVKRCNVQAVSAKTGKSYVKWPTLDELHQHLFQTSAQNLHNSLVDVMVCLRCFYMTQFSVDLLETCDEMKKVMGDLPKSP